MPLCGKSNKRKIFFQCGVWVVDVDNDAVRSYLDDGLRVSLRYVTPPINKRTRFWFIYIISQFVRLPISPSRMRIFWKFSFLFDSAFTALWVGARLTQWGRIYDHREQDWCALYLILYKREIENIQNSFASSIVDCRNRYRANAKRAIYFYFNFSHFTQSKSNVSQSNVRIITP